jgi:hypothetical protein
MTGRWRNPTTFGSKRLSVGAAASTCGASDALANVNGTLTDIRPLMPVAAQRDHAVNGPTRCFPPSAGYQISRIGPANPLRRLSPRRYAVLRQDLDVRTLRASQPRSARRRSGTHRAQPPGL